MKLKSIYIALGLSLLLSGCKSEEPAPQVQGEVNLPVSFTIQLAIESQNTRAGEDGTTWNGDNEADPVPGTENGSISNESGTNFDNTINSITPVLYSVKGQTLSSSSPVGVMIQQNEPQLMTDENDKVIPGKYIITGKMRFNSVTPEQLMNGNYRLAIFINCGEDDVVTPLNIMSPARGEFYHHGKPDDCRDKDKSNKHFHGIPMYGVGNVKFVEDKDEDDPQRRYKFCNENGQELNINILRSMAKVRVKLSDDLADDEKINLTELYISRHAIKGFVVPKGWNTTSDVATLTNGLAMNAFTGAIKDDYNHDCYVRPQTEENGNKVDNDDLDYNANTSELLRFYLPDTYNCDHDGIDDSDEIYLRLSYTVEDQEYTHLLWFRPVSEWPKEEGYGKILDQEGNIVSDTKINYPDSGTPWDIIRNHIYEFVIEGVEDNFGLKVAVNVKKWDYRKIETEL